MSIFTLPYCEECGEARVPHSLIRAPLFFENGFADTGFLGRMSTHGVELLDKIGASFFTPRRVMFIAKFFSGIGLGTLNTRAALHDNTRTLALYEGAEPAGVTLYAFKLFGVPICFIAEKNIGEKREQIVFHIIPRPKGFVSPSLAWMDDKGILKQKLIEAQLPCARGGVAKTVEGALKLFKDIGRPVITKPHHGSRGRHTTLDIRNEEDVKKGFHIAQQLTTAVIVEAYLKGTVHRVTLVGGEPVAVARREYPHVIGDGMHTVLELIDIENCAPYRNGVHFKKISTEHRVAQSLRKQELTLASVPENGRTVILNDKNSRLHGTLTEDVTDTVHRDNIELFRRIADMLADPIVGLDFMITNMKRSWKEQPDAGVIECNSMPFIDVHHRVVSGRQINVAEYLWNKVFKERVSEIK